jgi:hypothetical protein
MLYISSVRFLSIVIIISNDSLDDGLSNPNQSAISPKASRAAGVLSSHRAENTAYPVFMSSLNT